MPGIVIAIVAESQFVDSRQGSDLTSAGDRRGQMEEWDVYYLFVRNRNVTTNGYTQTGPG